MRRCVSRGRTASYARSLVRCALVTGVALFSASIASSSPATAQGSGAAAAASHELTLYSVATKKRFVNNADDRARGEGHNPFGNYAGSSVSPPANEKAYGPFPGDEGVFAFRLYANASHKRAAGSAIFICQYNFNQDSLCDASLQLDGGTLIGKGAYSFNAADSTLAILGGTAKYRGTTGVVEVAASGSATQPQPVFRVVPMLESQRLALTTASSAAGPKGPTVYSDPAHEIFINNDDDEARGDVNNPFGTHNATAANDEADGPFPGDEALFSFTIYADSSLATQAGSATYTCQYYFNKNTFCDASFDLKGGTVIAAGALNFSDKTFSLAITGGYGRYGAMTGEVQVTPSGKHAQRLVFVT